MISGKKIMIGKGELCPVCHAKGIMMEMHFGPIDSIQGFWICQLCGYVTKPTLRVR